MAVRVSVIIPTYKAAAWVEETLESVLAQTYPLDQLEIIVVDDVSPDDGAAVARRFLEKRAVKSQVVVREKNGGVGASRNTGWKLAEGEWIQFLDADDLLAPHKIALQMEQASSAPDDVGVIYTNWQYYVEQAGKWQPSGLVNAPHVDDAPVLRILQDQTFGYVGPTLVRKSCVERVGGFTEKPNLGEDSDLMLRLAIAGVGFRRAPSNEVAFLYRQWPNSQWRIYIKDVEAMRNLLLSYRGAEEFLRAQSPGGKLSAEARAALTMRYSRWTDFYFEQDRETFRLVMGWLRELGVSRPNNLARGMDLLSSLIGYERACRMRAAFRGGKKLITRSA